MFYPSLGKPRSVADAGEEPRQGTPAFAEGFGAAS